MSRLLFAVTLVASFGAHAQIEKDLPEHSGRIITVSYSPDGKKLIATGDEGTSLWDTASWTQEASYKLPSTSCSVRNDGNFAITTHNATFFERAGADAKQKATDGGGDQVWAVQLVGDDMYFTNEKGTLGRFDVKKGALVWSVPAHTSLAIGLHANGAFVATCAKDMTVKVWEAATGKAVRTYTGHEGSCENVRISADGKTLVSGGAEGLLFWDTATGAKKDQVNTSVFGLDMSRDGKLVAMTGKKGLSLWDPQSMKRLAAIGGVSFSAVAFSPDGKSLAASAEPREYVLRVFDVAALLAHPLDFRATAGPQLGSAYPINQLALSKDGKTLVTSRGGLQVWDTATERVRRRIDAGAFALSADGKSIAAADELGVRVIDVPTGATRTTIAVAGAAAVEAKDPKTGEVVSTAGPNSVDAVDIDARATRVLAIGPKSVSVLAVAGGKVVAKITPAADVAVARFSPDGKLVAVAAGPTIEIFDAATGKSRATLVGHAENVTSLAWSGNGKVIGTASRKDAKAITWDVAKKKKLATFSGHSGDVTAIDVDGTGQRAVSGSSFGPAVIWDAATGKELKVLRVPHEDEERDVARGYSGGLFDVHFTADGKKVFTSAANNSVRGYDSASGAPTNTISGFFGYSHLGKNFADEDPTLAKAPMPMTANAAIAHMAAMQACLDGNEDVALENIRKIPANLDFLYTDDNGNGWTLMMFAAEHNFVKATKELLALGADPSFVRKSGEGALHSAVRKGEDEILAMLLAAKVDIARANQDGETPLFLAAATGNVGAMKLLIVAGAPVDAKGPGGARPLHYAAAFGTPEAVKLLLEKKADPRMGDNDGASPRAWASDKGATENVKILEAAGG